VRNKGIMIAYPFPSSPERIQLILTKMVDSVANLRLTSECLNASEAGDILIELADCRQERIEDLTWLLASHGENPRRGTSAAFSIHRAWMRFIDKLRAPSDVRFVHECEQVDRRLEPIVAREADKVDPRSGRMLRGLARS
jgi:hypothetical protein